jgi:hypothetical protein
LGRDRFRKVDLNRIGRRGKDPQLQPKKHFVEERIGELVEFDPLVAKKERILVLKRILLRLRPPKSHRVSHDAWRIDENLHGALRSWFKMG